MSTEWEELEGRGELQIVNPTSTDVGNSLISVILFTLV